MLTCSPGAAPRRRASAASPRALSRPTSTSRAPSLASRSAASSPRPEVAPVTTQTLPCITVLLSASIGAITSDFTDSPHDAIQVSTTLILLRAIFVGAVVASYWFGSDAHAHKRSVVPMVIDNQPMCELGSMDVQRFDPIFILNLTDEEYRNDVHLSIQQYVIV